jgi:hypothetical protein
LGNGTTKTGLLAMISNVFLATNQPQEYIDYINRFNAILPIRSIFIQSLDQAKQNDLILEYSKSDQIRQEALTTLAQQMPGMSALRAGLHYLTVVTVASITEILLGFLSSCQTGMGHPPVSLSVAQCGHAYIINWGYPYIISVFEIVAALEQSGPGKQCDVIRLERMDRIILGALSVSKNEKP